MKFNTNTTKTNLYKFLADKTFQSNTTFLFDEKKEIHLKLIVKN